MALAVQNGGAVVHRVRVAARGYGGNSPVGLGKMGLTPWRVGAGVFDSVPCRAGSLV